MADVIVASATPWGHGALATVRFSGPDVRALLSRVVVPMGGKLPHGRSMRVALHDDGAQFDDGLAVYSAGPRSYTGEDTLEVNCHGNPLIVQRLLSVSIRAGARLALPGEFTKRALLSGKVDLMGAEAVDQLCRATTEAGLHIARTAMDGHLRAWLEEVRARLLVVAAELEARLDYPADELALEGDQSLLDSLAEVAVRAQSLADTAASGRVQVEGARVALVGSVNAGKSSLFNALMGRERALVHERAGTTRDVLEVRTTLGGLQITLLDTAGERPTDDPIEAAGLALAQTLTADADLLLIVLRARVGGATQAEAEILSRTAHRRRLVVYNGVDLPHDPAPDQALCTVAPPGEGVDNLKLALVDRLLERPQNDHDLVIASARQADLLYTIAAAAEEAIEALPFAGVAVAADAVTRCIESMDHLTGADTREDVLDAVFARFCIGK